MKILSTSGLSLVTSCALALGIAACGDDSGGSSADTDDAGLSEEGSDDGTDEGTDEPVDGTDGTDGDMTDETVDGTDEGGDTDEGATDEGDGTDEGDATDVGGETDEEMTDEEVTDGEPGGMDGGAPTEGDDDGGVVEEPAPSGDVDDLIGAICDWEFRCCDRGELDYRLGPNTDSAEDCRDDFVFELRQSNSTNNPFVSGSALGLLGQLAYTVNLSRVEPNAAAIAECIAMWDQMDCAQEPTEVTFCGGPVDYSDNPCALNNLFQPILEQDDECTLALTEGEVANDIECLPGSTCLAADDPDNPADGPACVQRGEAGQPCTNDGDCDFNYYCSAGDCEEKGDVGDDCSFEDPDDPQPGAEEAACKVGLTCHPEDLVCVDNCTEGFVCLVDSQCPEGFSCAPLSVGDDSSTWHVCRELGDSASARCDDDADCVENRYCNADGVCASDSDEDEDCDVDGQCPEGTYCDGTCTAFTLRGDACERFLTSRAGEYESPECEPAAVGCVYDEDDGQLECSSSKNSAGEECLDDYDCDSGLCEAVDADDDGIYRCTDGADDGDDCDEDFETADALRCGSGLACIDGSCEVQLPPGGECANDDGDADALMCLNSSCMERFDDPDVLICSDAPVPLAEGGSGLTCDGAEE